MKVFQGKTKVAFYWFFLTHIPITLMIDGQAIFASYYPQILRHFVQDIYAENFGDILMSGRQQPNGYPIWFQSIVLFEILFQLPFFFVSVHIIGGSGHNNNGNDHNNKNNQEGFTTTYPEWFRMACIVYGSHVATTLVPIFGTFVCANEDEMTTIQKIIIVSVYLPYLIFPLWLLCHATGLVDYYHDSKKEEAKKE